MQTKLVLVTDTDWVEKRGKEEEGGGEGIFKPCNEKFLPWRSKSKAYL